MVGEKHPEPILSVTLAYPFSKQILVSTCLKHKSFENAMGKAENARNEQFLIFPQCFLALWRNFCHFHQICNCVLQILSVWKSLKFVVWERAMKTIR